MFDKPFFFKINEGGGPSLLHQVFLERGWKEYAESASPKDGWNLWWKTGVIHQSQMRAMRNWQFLNHIPKASCICRKDYLTRYLKCMRNTFGAIYDFSPDAYILPLDYTKLIDECSRNPYGKNKEVWIYKPVGLSQGRGITLFKDICDMEYGQSAVVQRYIRNPLLIGGYKFDLRLYVCVPSFHPLTIYAYREGLARFSTDKFSLSDLQNKYAHLTNCSLNKLGPGYAEMKERVGAGCKWNLKQLRFYLEQNQYDDWLMWQRIASVMVLTIISQLGGIPSTTNCFEFYGFDILIDSSLKPWLLEVNLSPALCTDCDIDPAVKKPMLHDLFDLLGLPVCNTGLSLFSEWSDLGNCDSAEDLASFPRTVHVVSLANRWRRQVKSNAPKTKKYIHGKRQDNVNGKSGNRPNSARKSSSEGADIEAFGCPNRKSSQDQPKCKWGNGRDWRQAPKSEGDWVRIYPYRNKEPFAWGAESPLFGDRQIRSIVAKVVKLYKQAKETFVKTEKFSDDERDLCLLNSQCLLDAVWHPNK